VSNPIAGPLAAVSASAIGLPSVLASMGPAAAMGPMGSAFAIVAGAYLLGAVPWSYLIVRLATGSDVRSVGSGNAGATNVARAAGKGAGLLALLLDAAKGVVAVLVARRLGAPDAVVGAAALAAVLGHVFPVFLGFRGGKGVATGAGALATLAPWAGLLAFGTFVTVLAVTRYVSLASVAGAALFPIWIWCCGWWGWTAPPSPGLLGSAAAISLLVIWRHRSNLRRLRAGTERRVGERAATA
jgi:acyl phosphate:glycerol-3-phosphate acyltransferase